MVYDAEWESSGPDSRVLKINQNIPFKPGRDAYIFVRFSNRMLDKYLRLSLYTMGMHEIAVKLSPIVDSFDAVYWGTFTPEDKQKNYKFYIVIDGVDSIERYVPRGFVGQYGWDVNKSGSFLDKHPETKSYPALNKPPLFPFVNYEPGYDTTHSLEIGTVNRSVPASGGTIDFTSATLVLLAPDMSNIGCTKEYIQLTLNDTSVFLVEYQTTAADDACGVLTPYKEYLSSLLGLYIVHYPPLFWVSLYADQKDCTDLELYKSDTATRTHDLRQESHVGIYNPTMAFFTDKKLYLVIKNSDFNLQGTFLYNIRFGYQHAHDDYGIDFTAPAYQGRTTVERHFLKKLYDRIDLPRPQENWKAKYQRDVRTFVRQITAILLDDQTAVELQGFVKQNVSKGLADDCRLTAKAAFALGMVAEAEKLYKESSDRFSAQGDKKSQVSVLNDLYEVYHSAGMKTKADKVLSKIKNIHV
jgi:hypothetical protein